MTYVIMMNGHPACLKSTISKKLSEKLSIPLVRTNAFGGTISSNGYSTFELRNNRYQQAFKQAEELLKQKHSIVFDGTFTKLEWRKQLYDLCTKYKVDEVIIFRCISSNCEVVRKRFKKRAILEEQAEKDSIYFKNYLRDVPLDEPPLKDFINDNKQPSIFIFDSAKLCITAAVNLTDLTKKIGLDFSDVISTLIPDSKLNIMECK